MFQAHRLILASHSRFLHIQKPSVGEVTPLCALLGFGLRGLQVGNNVVYEVRLHNVDPDAFQRFLSILYGHGLSYWDWFRSDAYSLAVNLHDLGHEYHSEPVKQAACYLILGFRMDMKKPSGRCMNQALSQDLMKVLDRVWRSCEDAEWDHLSRNTSLRAALICVVFNNLSVLCKRDQLHDLLKRNPKLLESFLDIVSRQAGPLHKVRDALEGITSRLWAFTDGTWEPLTVVAT